MARYTPPLPTRSSATGLIKSALLGCLFLTAPRVICQTHAPASTPPPKVESASNFSGKVIETMDAAGYTYVLLNTGKQKLWVAAPRFAVKVGDSVAVADTMEMRNFRSQTLKREFDVVYFTGNVKLNGKALAASGGGETGELPKNHPPIKGLTTKPILSLSDIKKAEGGKSIAEIYAGIADLKGKEVKVRGKVVKYNPEVMGKNWLHIQDGTGSANSNDLTVTTSSKTKIGDTVLVTGRIATDRDFGGGYRYSVIIEDAHLVVE